ncbi:MAG: nitroreductase [Acetobacterales bacterium]
MDARELMESRASVPPKLLGDPAPEGETLDAILRAATRAPDHGRLRPWRFIMVRGEAREKLGEVYAAALLKRDPDATEALLQVERERPLRAPLLIVCVARAKQHPKIPEIEQILSAGSATHALVIAAQAYGFGAMWTTGPNAYDANVHTALGLEQGQRIVGFVNIGTPTGEVPPLKRPDPASFVEEWTGPA